MVHLGVTFVFFFFKILDFEEISNNIHINYVNETFCILIQILQKNYFK